MATSSPTSAAGWVEFLTSVNIPVLRRTAAALERLRANADDVDAREIAEAVDGDPFFAMRLFAQLSRVRHDAGAEVTTVERAVVMMGVMPFFRAFGKLPVVEDRLAGNRAALAGLMRILRRARRASAFALQFAGWRNDLGVEEIVLAAQLHDLAEMLLCCVAPEKALEVQRLLAAPGVRSVVAQRAVLGTTLAEVELAVARRWRLPELLLTMIDEEHHDSPRVRTVALAVRLARHSAKSWNDPALPDDYRDVAQLLSTTPEHVMEIVRPENAA